MSESQNGPSASETRAAEILLSGALRPPASSGPCLSEEALAAFVDGRGTSAERAAAIAHIESCEVCAAVVSGVAELAGELGPVVAQPLPGTRSRRPFGEWLAQHRAMSISALAAAAAVVLAVWVGGAFFSADARLERSLAQLDQVLGEFRPVEARLTGAAYRPALPATRAAAPAAEPSLEVRDLANAVERAARDVAPEARAHAMAKVYLETGRSDRAIATIAPFASATGNPRLLSDVSAAYFARGDFAEALAAATRAVEMDPRLVEAWFNLGLVNEALGKPSDAAKAWDRVIELEPSSQWAREAAQRRRVETPKRAPGLPTRHDPFGRGWLAPGAPPEGPRRAL